VRGAPEFCIHARPREHCVWCWSMPRPEPLPSEGQVVARCRRCLGDHPTRVCAYDVTEASAARGARLTAEPRLAVYLAGSGQNPQPSASEAGTPSRSAVAVSRPSEPAGSKASRGGRPAIDPVLKRRHAADRQARYRARVA